MASLLDLADRMEKQAGEQDMRASKKSVAIANAILRQLLFNTPVDTSLAVSNWQVGIGSRVDNMIPAYAYGSRGSTLTISASEAFAVARRKLAVKKPGQPIFISNLVDYIGELNRGSSKQAPAGFIEQAILVGRKTAEGLRK